MPRFHVTSSLNRASIERFGLDWDHMGAAPGIAGSPVPEVEGCFLADAWEVEWFLRFGRATTADVWQVDGIDEESLLDNGTGYLYYPGRIPPHQLTLVRTDVPPAE